MQTTNLHCVFFFFVSVASGNVVIPFEGIVIDNKCSLLSYILPKYRNEHTHTKTRKQVENALGVRSSLKLILVLCCFLNPNVTNILLIVPYVVFTIRELFFKPFEYFKTCSHIRRGTAGDQANHSIKIRRPQSGRYLFYIPTQFFKHGALFDSTCPNRCMRQYAR